jgi:hypothetical protein
VRGGRAIHLVEQPGQINGGHEGEKQKVSSKAAAHSGVPERSEQCDACQREEVRKVERAGSRAFDQIGQQRARGQQRGSERLGAEAIEDFSRRREAGNEVEAEFD